MWRTCNVKWQVGRVVNQTSKGFEQSMSYNFLELYELFIYDIVTWTSQSDVPHVRYVIEVPPINYSNCLGRKSYGTMVAILTLIKKFASLNCIKFNFISPHLIKGKYSWTKWRFGIWRKFIYKMEWGLNNRYKAYVWVIVNMSQVKVAVRWNHVVPL